MRLLITALLIGGAVALFPSAYGQESPQTRGESRIEERDVTLPNGERGKKRTVVDYLDPNVKSDRSAHSSHGDDLGHWRNGLATMRFYASDYWQKHYTHEATDTWYAAAGGRMVFLYKNNDKNQSDIPHCNTGVAPPPGTINMCWTSFAPCGGAAGCAHVWNYSNGHIYGVVAEICGVCGFGEDTFHRITNHEVGHGIGHGHTDDEGSLMYPIVRHRYPNTHDANDAVAVYDHAACRCEA